MIFENLIYVLILVIIGNLCRKSPWFPKNTDDVLNSFVLNISLPAIIIVSIPKLTIDSQMLYPVLIHWVALPLHVLMIFIAAKMFGLTRSTVGALIIVSTLGNTAFVGIPMIGSFLGESAIPFAVLYDQLGSGIGFIIYGAFVLPLYTASKRKTAKEIIHSLLTFPAFLALIFGFVLKLTPPLPSILNTSLASIAATLIPCAMISVGFSMSYRLSRKVLKPLSIGLALKLILLPLCVLGITKFVGISGVAVKSSILQAGMSPMITAGAMATAAKLETKLSVALVAFGLILSFLSLPVIEALL